MILKLRVHDPVTDGIVVVGVNCALLWNGGFAGTDSSGYDVPLPGATPSLETSVAKESEDWLLACISSRLLIISSPVPLSSLAMSMTCNNDGNLGCCYCIVIGGDGILNGSADVSYPLTAPLLSVLTSSIAFKVG